MSDFRDEILPALKVIGLLTMNALDSLPLPLLVVVFLALLSTLRQPSSPRSPVLPSFSPTFLEKARLSPLPFSPGLPSSPSLHNLPVFYPTLDLAGRPQYVAVAHDSPPRVGRRGSKQREWRHGLGSLEEKDEVVTEV